MRDGGVVLEDTARCVEMKEGIDLEEIVLGTIGVAPVPLVVLDVDAVGDDAIDCDRKPRIGPRICAFECASKAIGAVSSTCTVVFNSTISCFLVTPSFSRIRAPAP